MSNHSSIQPSVIQPFGVITNNRDTSVTTLKRYFYNIGFYIIFICPCISFKKNIKLHERLQTIEISLEIFFKPPTRQHNVQRASKSIVTSLASCTSLFAVFAIIQEHFVYPCTRYPKYSTKYFIKLARPRPILLAITSPRKAIFN